MFNADLLNYKSAGLLTSLDLDEYDSELAADLLALHDEIAFNPVRGMIPDYQGSYTAKRTWNYTYNAVRNRLLPAVAKAKAEVSKGAWREIEILIRSAVRGLSLAQHELDQSGDPGKSSKNLEMAFQQVHEAIDLIREDTRRVPKVKSLKPRTQQQVTT